MKLLSKIKLALISSSLLVAGNSMAEEPFAYIQSVTIEKISVLSVAAVGHLAGNVELKIKNGFSLPEGWTCSTEYLTTKKEFMDDRLFSLLLAAHAANRPVSLYISDASTYNAIDGRCSIAAGILEPNT